MRIAVIGIGYVGAVTSACLCETGHKVIAIDIDQKKVDAINEGKAPIYEKGLEKLIQKHRESNNLSATNNIQEAMEHTDMSLICVGTPSQKDGSLDLSYVVKACEEIGIALKNITHRHTIVMRSTMLPGSAENLCIPAIEETSGLKAYDDFGFGNNPEFLREGSAIYDYFNPPKIVVGSDNDNSADLIMSLYDQIKMAEGKKIKTSLKISEGVKYADNAWHAMKIGFANELGNILSDCGVDSHKVMDIFCQDKKLNISPAYLKPGFAFGGSCLPKDVRAIRALGKEKGLETSLFDSLMIANDNQFKRAFDAVITAQPKHVTLLGLSFKADTDDLRESPLVTLAEQLIKTGICLEIIDPIVARNYQENDNSIIKRTHFIDAPSSGSDYFIIGNSNPGFIQIVKDHHKSSIQILDLVRLSPDIEDQEGYRGICW